MLVGIEAREEAEQDAWQVMQALAQLASATYGARLASFLVYGSLANGDFVPLYSDMDHLIVLAEGALDEAAYQGTHRLVQAMRQRFPDAPGRLQEGNIVEAHMLNHCNLDDDRAFLPRDVADIKLHGRVLLGEEIRAALRMPTLEAMREAAVWGLYWSKPFIETASLKALLNMIFGVAGLWYLIESETMTYSKGALTRDYLAAHLPYAELVDRAAERRYAWEPADEGLRAGPEHAYQRPADERRSRRGRPRPAWRRSRRSGRRGSGCRTAHSHAEAGDQ